MFLYSSLLTMALIVSAPWWLWRMASSGRYRAGLRDRLGMLPRSLDDAIARRGAAAGLIWVHAVSVGEVLAVERLIAELPTAFPGYQIVVSTTTATGQAIARQKLDVPVFYFPLDFAFAVRRYLRALRPTLILLVESELWPRLLHEAATARIPVAVVNARVSDRSYRRTYPFRKLWLKMARNVKLFCPQSNETASRLSALGIMSSQISTAGNLKYDSVPQPNQMVEALRPLLERRKLVVAGSLLEGEEMLLLAGCWELYRAAPQTVLLLAPRHPERFDRVAAMTTTAPRIYRASELLVQSTSTNPLLRLKPPTSILLDTVGDLASIYSLAEAAIIGGSFFGQGGHNPLEAARFGVPIIMGGSYENFREIVESMLAERAILIVEPTDAAHLSNVIAEVVADDKGLGERGRLFFESQSGATARTIAALQGLIQ